MARRAPQGGIAKVAMRILGFFCAFAACVLLLAGCALREDAPNSDLFEIGVLLPFEGGYAEASREIFEGMCVARDFANAEGGVGGARVVLDPVSVQSAGVLSAVDALGARGVGVFCLGIDENIAYNKEALAKRENMFFCFLGAYPPATLDMPNSARIFLNGAQQGDLMADFARRKCKKGTSYVVMAQNGDVWKSLADYLVLGLDSRTVKIYRDSFSPKEGNFAEFARAVRRTGAECIFYIGAGGNIKEFAQAFGTGRDAPLVAANCPLLAPRTADGEWRYYGVQPAFENALSGAENGLKKRFSEEYERRFGRRAGWLAHYGFDAVYMACAAAKEGAVSPRKMREYFTNSTRFGVCGKLEFDSSADCYTPLEFAEKRSGNP